jgi:sporulation protein YlmC with PRC-barrel domain
LDKEEEMRLWSVVLVAVAAGFLLAPTASLGVPPPATRPGVTVDVQPGGVHVAAPGVRIGEGMTAKATDLIGLTVFDSANADLGKIENLVVDTTSGTVRYAVLSFGTTLGMGGKLVAIPWDQLRLASKEAGGQAGMSFVFDAPKDVIVRAPVFQNNQWPNFADRHWSVEIDKYFNTHRAARRVTREREIERR